MPRWLEFHDSDLIDVALTDGTVTVGIRAYVHEWNKDDSGWAGTGWMQLVQILLPAGFSPDSVSAGEIWDGWLQVGDNRLCNLVPLPFASDLPTHLHLELNAGPVIDIHAERASVLSSGPATFVERLRDSMRPDSAG